MVQNLSLWYVRDWEWANHEFLLPVLWCWDIFHRIGCPLISLLLCLLGWDVQYNDRSQSVLHLSILLSGNIQHRSRRHLIHRLLGLHGWDILYSFRSYSGADMPGLSVWYIRQ
jgi:hypothetical protein